ncbi:hypothetical protein GSU68_16220 [Rathayibacter sp. VKM Ac-2759]|uniref:hypothetical protein n=1 Tax=Rathayibacter sp. VKM Ac-2759 TaxID=2609252 RepID=UPI001318D102|nr:hypothetical protein [Rathayibacter sp. VKM Ac-2759]QHC67958.1 hypothetical protein GSU68_16220 [Rathayibacter sp. VKM Ac-2759]
MRRILPWIVPAAGLALIAAGLVVGVTAPSAVSFGWFAYAPLSETTFSPDTVVLARGVATAWALAALGALLLAFSAGWLLALRRERRRLP